MPFWPNFCQKTTPCGQDSNPQTSGQEAVGLLPLDHGGWPFLTDRKSFAVGLKAVSKLFGVIPNTK